MSVVISLEAIRAARSRKPAGFVADQALAGLFDALAQARTAHGRLLQDVHQRLVELDATAARLADMATQLDQLEGAIRIVAGLGDGADLMGPTHE